ncbi:hypothetical protein BJ742DRAFT_778780 [Cladochytrium replicatum]|nr:hypothetical protein BJ742DRAFT_778780 [Cladochytrium replicatum]
MVNTKMIFGDDWDEKDLEEYKWAFVISDPGNWITNPVNPSPTQEIGSRIQSTSCSPFWAET